MRETMSRENRSRMMSRNASSRSEPLGPELGTSAVSRVVRRNIGSSPAGRFRLALPLIAIVSLGALGCATQGDFLRLQEKVADLHPAGREAPDPFARIASLSSEVDALHQQVRDLQGELELARKEAADAFEEASRARRAIAEGAIAGEAGEGVADGAQGAEGADEGQVAALAGEEQGGDSAAAPDEELEGYQRALNAWRSDDHTACIDQFTSFLQGYPTSGYADDAAYWLADCTYKNDEFKRAVVRFNAVVSVYPDSPKAPDALYRQGESLLKLGPKFHEAARTVFRRVQKDYPESDRAVEAARQLKRLGPGA
ncbi:MAG: tol-pal system protein YbgF [Deltaproteobacteria bacterium]|nr:tol-pal system protein YbgF [Deltaproteobacteria bacterium]